MPFLISDAVYNETLALIDGIKKPDPVLESMQIFYAAYGIKLYNLYENTLYGDKIISALTNVIEGTTRIRPELATFDEDSLNEYERLCKLYNVDISGYANFTRSKRVLGTGFYFDRIWSTELINQIAPKLKEDILAVLTPNDGTVKVVNSGLGAITIFQDTKVTNKTRLEIKELTRDAIASVDRWGICSNKKVVYYDTFENLNKNFGGSLKEYYM